MTCLPFPQDPDGRGDFDIHAGSHTSCLSRMKERAAEGPALWERPPLLNAYCMDSAMATMSFTVTPFISSSRS